VPPEEKKAVGAACERHRGMLDDAIITICREASKEELDDSRWATLKSRMLDQIRPILGDERIRQLSFADFGWEPI
jgi:flagellar basal body-associated protein FliL